MYKQSMKSIIERKCLNKVDRSKEEVDFIVDQKALKGEIIYYYKCDLCNRYHLTSMDHELHKLEIV